MMNRVISFTLGVFITIMMVDVVLAYRWPLRPNSQAHPINSVLNEVRFARSYFHDGVDISAPQNTTVIAVFAGTARRGGSGDDTYVTVRVAGVDSFWYVHLDSLTRVPDGRSVSVGDSLGKTNALNHVHFGEGPDQQEINPLRSGGLNPRVTDNSSPRINSIYLLRNDNEDEEVPALNVTGLVDIVVALMTA